MCCEKQGSLAPCKISIVFIDQLLQPYDCLRHRPFIEINKCQLKVALSSYRRVPVSHGSSEASSAFFAVPIGPM